MKRRNFDGTFRNNNKPKKVSTRWIMARWFEAEVLALKLLGFTLARIAMQITEVGQGRQRPITPLPPGASFAPNFSISVTACYRALKRAFQREPQIGADRLRQLVNQRIEQLFLACQPLAQRGEVRTMLVMVRLLELQASINNVKLSHSPAVVEEKRQEDSPPASLAIINLFEGAIEILHDCGAVPRPSNLNRKTEPKLVDVTPTKPDSDALPT